MADMNTGEHDVAATDQGYGTDTTQDFGGEDSDAVPPPPAEATGYHFLESDGVKSYDIAIYRILERDQLMLFKRSQRDYHPGLSASLAERFAWSTYDYEKEDHEADKAIEDAKFPGLNAGYSIPESPYDQWRKEHPNEPGHQAWLEAFTKTKDTDKERGTKRAHGDMAQELPTKPANEETQL
jgi:hypothetical protein